MTFLFTLTENKQRSQYLLSIKVTFQLGLILSLKEQLGGHNAMFSVQAGQSLYLQPQQDQAQCQAGGRLRLHLQLKPPPAQPVLQVPPGALPPLLQLRLLGLH